jgi:hypothetical protein
VPWRTRWHIGWPPAQLDPTWLLLHVCADTASLGPTQLWPAGRGAPRWTSHHSQRTRYTSPVHGHCPWRSLHAPWKMRIGKEEGVV